MNYHSLFSLEGRNIIITGGLGILGIEFARGIVAHGGKPILIERDLPSNREKFLKLLAELGQNKLDCRFFNLDDIHKYPQLIHEIKELHGPIYGLLNNAAIKTPGFFNHFLEYRTEDWETVMRINAESPYFLAQLVAKHMIEHGIRGSIVSTLSIYGLVGPRESIYEGSMYEGRPINTPPIYAASKAALGGITRYLATCLGKEGIRVNAVTPGGVASGQNDAFSSKYSAHVPLGRQADAHEIVGAAIFFFSDASSYVTGHNLVVDGGWTCW